MKGWKKEKPYKDKIHQGCMNCPPVESIAPMDTIVAVGFGDAHISKDDKIIFDERRGEEPHELKEFEEMAQQDPDHDWRLVLYAPLRGRIYQRHGKEKWVLIESNMGFA
jgi:hypothetical protein